MKMFSKLCVLMALSISIACHAEGSVAKVVGILDGDTIKVLYPGNMEKKIRLANIDAPEKSQPFGARSKQSLSELAYGRMATVEIIGADRYGREIAVVSVEGMEVNREQVRRGMAWVYEKYNNDPSLYELQGIARKSRIGLWSDPDPVKPENYRRLQP